MITNHELYKGRTWVIISMDHDDSWCAFLIEAMQLPGQMAAYPCTAEAWGLPLAAQEYAACIGPDCCMPAVKVAHRDGDAPCIVVICWLVPCLSFACSSVFPTLAVWVGTHASQLAALLRDGASLRLPSELSISIEQLMAA